MGWLWLMMWLGCGLTEGYATGLRTFCEAPSRCPTCAEAATDAERAERATAWAGTAIGNAQARMVFDKTATFPPERRGGVLRAAASKQDIRPCEMADLYDLVAR